MKVDDKMKKIALAGIIMGTCISLIGCNSQSTSNNTQQTKQKQQATSESTSEITVEQAKEIVLKHANLKKDKVVFGRAEMDYDDGIQTYDIEFYYNNMEYNYEIDANTGNILSYEQD